MCTIYYVVLLILTTATLYLFQFFHESIEYERHLKAGIAGLVKDFNEAELKANSYKPRDLDITLNMINVRLFYTVSFLLTSYGFQMNRSGFIINRENSTGIILEHYSRVESSIELTVSL